MLAFHSKRLLNGWLKWLAGSVPNAVNLSNFAEANTVPVEDFFKPIQIAPSNRDSFITGTGFIVNTLNTPSKKPVDIVPPERNLAPVKPILPNLIERLKKATEPRGKKTELAEFLSAPLPRVSEWLRGDKKPGGETTLQMLQWVEDQERQK
jgi:hypothetical protein